MAEVARLDFARDPEEVARDLLGMALLHQGVGGTIVEVEAYGWRDDPASHAFAGPTERNRAMFEEPGRSYVYFIYGMHHCLNVVAHRPGEAGAVLIRALEPGPGLEVMRERRNQPDSLRRLTSGPGMVCQALGLDRSHNRLPFDDPRGLWLGPAQSRPEVAVSGRVGIRQAIDRPLRFFIKGNLYVSRGRPAWSS